MGLVSFFPPADIYHRGAVHHGVPGLKPVVGDGQGIGRDGHPGNRAARRVVAAHDPVRTLQGRVEGGPRRVDVWAHERVEPVAALGQAGETTRCQQGYGVVLAAADQAAGHAQTHHARQRVAAGVGGVRDEDRGRRPGQGRIDRRRQLDAVVADPDDVVDVVVRELRDPLGVSCRRTGTPPPDPSTGRGWPR